MPPAATGAVSVLFARSGKEARWMPESGSLLELAEARGLNPPYSCRSGTCGSCRHLLAQGSVTYPNKPPAPCGDNELLLCRPLLMQGSKAPGSEARPNEGKPRQTHTPPQTQT